MYSAVGEYAKGHDTEGQTLDEPRLRIFAQEFYATQSMGHKGFSSYLLFYTTQHSIPYMSFYNRSISIYW